MAFTDWDDFQGEFTDEERLVIEKLKTEARAERLEFSLAELRKHRDITQAELAKILDRTQPSISSLENGDDPLLSTLRAAIEGMGGELELTAIFGDQRVVLAA